MSARVGGVGAHGGRLRILVLCRAALKGFRIEGCSIHFRLGASWSLSECQVLSQWCLGMLEGPLMGPNGLMFSGLLMLGARLS